jgi:hypothetical protein
MALQLDLPLNSHRPTHRHGMTEARYASASIVSRCFPGPEVVTAIAGTPMLSVAGTTRVTEGGFEA